MGRVEEAVSVRILGLGPLGESRRTFVGPQIDMCGVAPISFA